jgi:methylglutaconyl-CoA hydratase
VLLRRMIGEKLALDLILTGRLLRASDAVRVGLLTRSVPAEALEAEVADLVAALTRSSASALALTKQLFYRLDHMLLADGIALAARTDALVRSTPDFNDALRRFLRG